METNEVSLHQAKLFAFLKDTTHWMTLKDIAAQTGISYRTTHAHVSRFVKAGLVDQAEVFPEHRYRFSKNAKKRNIAYMQRLHTACEVFGLA